MLSPTPCARNRAASGVRQMNSNTPLLRSTSLLALSAPRASGPRASSGKCGKGGKRGGQADRSQRPPKEEGGPGGEGGAGEGPREGVVRQGAVWWRFSSARPGSQPTGPVPGQAFPNLCYVSDAYPALPCCLASARQTRAALGSCPDIRDRGAKRCFTGGGG